MKTVTSHRFASSRGCTLYDSVNGKTICQVEAGSWLGVVVDSGEWLQIITATENGWVRADQTVQARPYGLKALSNKVTGLIQNYVLL